MANEFVGVQRWLEKPREAKRWEYELGRDGTKSCTATGFLQVEHLASIQVLRVFYYLPINLSTDTSSPIACILT